MCIQVTLPLPPSSNRYWRKFNNRMVLSKEADEYKLAVYWAIRERGIPTLLTGPVTVTVEVYRKRRAGDLDNKLKCLLDAIQGVLIVNDSQVVELHAYLDDDPKNPRVELSLKEAV